MNAYEKPLKTDSSYKHISIGYLGPKLLAPMRIKLLSGIKKAAHEHGVTLFHFGGPYPHDSEKIISQSIFIYKLLSRKKIDGIICWLSQFENENGFFIDIERLIAENSDIPIVFVGKTLKDYPTLMINNHHGINKIMNHLIHVHNYRKIAFLRGPEYHSYARERYEAYLNTLKSNRIAFNPQLVSPPNDYKREFGEKAISYFFDKLKLKPKKDIEAIVSVSDMLSFTAIEGLKKRNIQIPQEIAVVGFNNKYDSLSSNPMMTTVDIDAGGIGERSIELLLSIINGEKKSGIFYTPTKLIIRQSCGCIYGDFKVKKSSHRIPVNINHDQKKEFVKTLNQQNKKIIPKMNKIFDNISSFNDSWSEALFNGLVDSIKTESSILFLSVVENIIVQMTDYEINTFIWNQYFTKFRELILPIISDNDLRNWVEMLFYFGNSLLIQQAEREIAFNHMNVVNYESRTINLYQSIVSTYELSTLVDILANELPAFGIDACYFSLFHDPEDSIKYAELKLAYNSNGVYELSENKNVFESAQLIPAKYYKEMDKISYFVLPLFFQDNPMGFIVLGISVLSEFNGIIYEVLRSLISSTLQGIMDMQDLKKTQAQLEKKAEEQRKAVLEANEANQAKSRFLRNMSHEIRTPLNCIIGFLEVLKNENDKYQAGQYINTIQNESNKLLELINQLLDISKAEAGKFEIINARFNIIKTLMAVHSTFSQSARNKGLDFEADISEDIPAFLIGDSLRLRQIITNLVGNAIKFTDHGGISFSASIQKETDKEITLYFEISDTGIGIPEKFQKVIFNPFIQVEASTIRKFGGSGLGTAISRQLVHMMGGEIGVESKIGEGSRFWFTIKYEKCSQEEKTPVSEEIEKLIDTEERILKRAAILLVDDYPTNRKVATIHLKKLGCKIDYAENGKIAVNKFMNGKYDLILMDIQMPEMDGLEATKQIRILPGGKQIPIIAMTAIAYVDEIKIFKEHDMDDVITKPFHKKGFSETVIYWLTHRKKINSI